MLRVDRSQIDAARFEDLVRAARTDVARSPERAAATLRQALALWRGTALSEFAELGFAQSESARLGEARLAATEDLVRAELALGRHAEIVGELGALVSATPLRESLTGFLMLALYRSGRQADALRAYRYLRKALGEELGIDPSPALAALEVAMLRQEPDLDFAPAPAGEGHLAGARRGRRFDPRRARTSTGPGRRGRRSSAANRTSPCSPRHASARAGLPARARRGRSRHRQVPPRRRSRPAHRRRGPAGPVRASRRTPRRRLPAVGAGPSPNPGRRRSAGPGRYDAAPPADGPVAVTIPVDEADARRLRFFTAATAAFSAATLSTGSIRRIVLVLDDLQWADVPSLLFLRHLLLEAPELPLTVLGVSRLGPRPPVLDSTVAALELTGVARHLTLHGLGADDVEELVEHRLAENGLVGREPEGGSGRRWPAGCGPTPAATPCSSPRCSVTWPRGGGGAGRAGGPGLHPGRRPQQGGLASAATASLLVAAAVLGKPGSGPVLGRIAGLDEEATVTAIVEASDARFLVPVADDPGVFEFAHAVLRAAVYDDVPLARRFDLHRRAAVALQAEPGAEGRAAELARHWTCAGRFGDPAAAIRYRRLAGDAADRSLGYEQAAGHYRAALALIDQYPEHADQVARCEILLSLAATENRSGDANAGKEACRVAAELAGAAGRGDLLARAALEYGGALAMGSAEVDDPEAQRLLRRALAAVDPESIEAGLMGARLAQLDYWRLPRAERRELCDTAARLARAAGDRNVLATVLLSRYWALNCPDELDERLALADELDGLADVDGSPSCGFRPGSAGCTCWPRWATSPPPSTCPNAWPWSRRGSTTGSTCAWRWRSTPPSPGCRAASRMPPASPPRPRR